MLRKAQLTVDFFQPIIDPLDRESLHTWNPLASLCVPLENTTDQDLIFVYNCVLNR